MRQRHRLPYSLAFLLVLAAAVGGALWTARRVGPVEVPRVDVVDRALALAAEIDPLALLPPVATPRPTEQPRPTALPSAPTPTPTPEPVAAAPEVSVETLPPPEIATATPPPGLTPAPPTPNPRPTPTPAPPTPTPTAQAAYPFMPAGPVRHTSGDCPGPSVRGVVRDAAGNGLAGVRLWRYDQWGNQQTVETKSAAGEVGRYDFPLGDTPNVHYVQVVDAAGVPISPRVEVPHRQGEAGDNPCHWVDWVRR
ncbi:MAG: hypothetical protein RMN53_11425 [Anaerolineae bacterium]|nr:hypothetical protein [Anaerolineae bacterium]